MYSFFKATGLFCFLLFQVNSILAQNTHVVDDDGNGDFTTIAAAITSPTVANGDTLDITGGADNIHTETGITVSKSLTFRGQGQNTTIVQADTAPGLATNRIFTINQQLTNLFQDFTIRYGNITTNASGGALFINCSATTDVTFERMTITQNRSGDDGGAMVFAGDGAKAVFVDCLISDNEANLTFDAADGGAIVNLGVDDFQMIRCTISGNRSGDDIGGIWIQEDGSVNQFVNCTLYGNESGFANPAGTIAGAMYINNSQSNILTNCTIVNNHMRGPGAREGGGIRWAQGDLTLRNMIVANNSGASSAVTGDDISVGPAVGTLTLSSSLIEDCDGCSVAPTYTSDPNLAPVAFCGVQAYFDPQAGSDALDNGTGPSANIPTDDICGNSRLGPVDLGSYEDTIRPLPFTLLDFRATREGAYVLLAWETARERDGLSFEIEHRGEEAYFETIGKAEPVQESGFGKHYGFFHKDPVPGHNFYRLRVLRQNGELTHSRVIPLFFPEREDALRILVGPNPTAGLLNAEVFVEEQGVVSVEIQDLGGKLILSKKERLHRGNHRIALDLRALASGMYLYCIRNGSWINTGKVVIRN